MAKSEKSGAKRKEARAGYVLLAAPPFASACSVDGTTYRVADGLIEVQEAHVATLAAHGFLPPPPSDAD